MKPRTRILLATALFVGAAGMAASAAPPPDKGHGKRQKSDFVRGNANTRARRVVQPRTEAQAVAQRRFTSRGIVEMQLPEDRMVDLVLVKRADGSTGFMHQDADTVPAILAGEGEVE